MDQTGEGAMPKEYVTGTQWSGVSVGATDGSPPALHKIKVSWSRVDEGGQVQVVTFRDDGTYQSEHEDPMYVDLSRYEINKLIRVLRRARDSAFGRDA
jgi:hypothetical protein